VLDTVQRARARLEMERYALQKETDSASQARLEQLEQELADRQEEERELTTRWEAERRDLQAVRDLQGNLETARERRLEMVYGRVRMEHPVGSWTEVGEWPPGHTGLCHDAALYSARLGFRYDPFCWVEGEPGDWNLWKRMKGAEVRMGFLEQLVGHHFAEFSAMAEGERDDVRTRKATPEEFLDDLAYTGGEHLLAMGLRDDLRAESEADRIASIGQIVVGGVVREEENGVFRVRTIANPPNDVRNAAIADRVVSGRGERL